MTTTTTIAMTARAATIPPTIEPMGAAVVRRKIITVKKESSLTFETNTHEREERFCKVNEATRNNRHILGQAPVSSNRRAVVPPTNDGRKEIS